MYAWIGRYFSADRWGQLLGNCPDALKADCLTFIDDLAVGRVFGGGKINANKIKIYSSTRKKRLFLSSF
jgi:hypothetical protein